MTEISKEYAVALFSLAREKEDRILPYRDALRRILSAFEEQPEYISLLSSPSIPIRERRALIEQAFADSVPEQVLSFTELLCEKGHLRLFENCVKEYEELCRAASSVSSARVVSAVPLTDGEKTTLIAKLEKFSGHRVEAHYETDETLIGGVTVYMDDTVIDGSLRRKLKQVKEVLGK